MFCPQCNSQVPDGDKFCPNCGADTELASAQPRRRRVGVIVGVIAGFAAIVALLFVFVIRPMSSESDSGTVLDSDHVSSSVEDYESLQDERLTDVYGNITCYAFLELDGSALISLLNDAGYSWDDGSGGFLRDDDQAWFIARGVRAGGLVHLSEERIHELGKGGGDTPVRYEYLVCGYTSFSDALEGILGSDVNIVDYFAGENGTGNEFIYAIVSNSAGDNYQLYLSYYPSANEDDGVYALTLHNDGYAAFNGYATVADEWANEFATS